MNNTGIVILAAGASSRFGTPKQLAQFKGKTFLQHVIDEAKDANVATIVVVTGASTEQVSSSLAYAGVEILFNKDWANGMASGIVAGVKAIIQKDTGIEKIIIAVCDQPFVNSSLFKQLDRLHQQTGKGIVASAYANTVGTPVLFTRKYFDQLSGLEGDTGAKSIVRENADDVATVDFPKGVVDIDTQDDLGRLLDEKSKNPSPESPGK